MSATTDRFVALIRRQRLFVLRDFAQAALFAGTLVATVASLL